MCNIRRRPGDVTGEDELATGEGTCEPLPVCNVTLDHDHVVQTPSCVSSPNGSASPQRHAIDEARSRRSTDILLPSCFAAYVIVPLLPPPPRPPPSPLSTLVTASLSTATDPPEQFISLLSRHVHPGPALLRLSRPGRCEAGLQVSSGGLDSSQ